MAIQGYLADRRVKLIHKTDGNKSKSFAEISQSMILDEGMTQEGFNKLNPQPAEQLANKKGQISINWQAQSND